MFRTRRRRENARTDAFLAALRATASPGRALLLPVRTDTATLPRIIATATTPPGGWQAVA